MWFEVFALLWLAFLYLWVSRLSCELLARFIDSLLLISQQIFSNLFQCFSQWWFLLHQYHHLQFLPQLLLPSQFDLIQLVFTISKSNFTSMLLVEEKWFLALSPQNQIFHNTHTPQPYVESKTQVRLHFHHLNFSWSFSFLPSHISSIYLPHKLYEKRLCMFRNHTILCKLIQVLTHRSCINAKVSMRIIGQLHQFCFH